MKVLFYDCGYETFGVQYLLSTLKKHGHQAALFFDGSFSKDYLAQDFFLTGAFSLSSRQVCDAILKESPEAVCFSMYTMFYRENIKVIELLKEADPKIVIICGGFHASLLPGTVLGHREVDFAVIGEAEHSLPSLLDAITRLGVEGAKALRPEDLKGVWNVSLGAVVDRGLSPIPQDLDAIPFPDKELYYRANPALSRIYTVIASRGCPYECTYCNSATMNKFYRAHREKYYRVRSVGNVISELEAACRDHHPEHVMFFDDVFGARLEWLREFSAAYKEKIGLPYYCQTSPLIHNSESLDLLADSGCCLLEFGFQSANAGVRREILNRNEENAGMMELVKQARKRNIFTELDLIVNLPGEKGSHIKENLAFVAESRPHWVNLAFLQFHPKTAIIDIALRENMLNKDDVAAIEAGKKASSMRLLSKSGLGNEYRILPLQMFLAFYFPQWISGTLIRVVAAPVIREICSALASVQLYVSRIMLSYMDKRDFLVRHHVLRCLYAARWVLRKKVFPNAG